MKSTFFLFLLAVAAAAVGCTSASKAEARAAKAFEAGQARAAMVEEARRTGILVTGPVLNPFVQWQEGMTLAQAILTARWSGMGNPRAVILTRAGERVELTPNESIAAAELPMEPGDEIELVP